MWARWWPSHTHSLPAARHVEDEKDSRQSLQCCVITLITGVSTENVQMLRAYKSRGIERSMWKEDTIPKGTDSWDERRVSYFFFLSFWVEKQNRRSRCGEPYMQKRKETKELAIWSSCLILNYSRWAPSCSQSTQLPEVPESHGPSLATSLGKRAFPSVPELGAHWPGLALGPLSFVKECSRVRLGWPWNTQVPSLRRRRGYN